MQSVSDEERRGEGPLGGRLEEVQEARRPMTTSNHAGLNSCVDELNKEHFRRILGNRTQNLFLLAPSQEVPKSRVTKPHQIVD